MHTRQWIGTGCEVEAMVTIRVSWLRRGLPIKAYLAHFALTPQAALVRLDGQYGDAVVIAQLIEAGVHLITRGRTYRMLERPQIQRVLTR
jgi:hypothetical protein